MTKLYFDLLNSPAEAHSSIQKSLLQALSTTIPILEFPSETVYACIRMPLQVSDIYQKIHETTLRTPVEMGVRPNSITLEEYQIAIISKPSAWFKICRMETKVRRLRPFRPTCSSCMGRR